MVAEERVAENLASVAQQLADTTPSNNPAAIPILLTGLYQHHPQIDGLKARWTLHRGHDTAAGRTHCNENFRDAHGGVRYRQLVEWPA